MFHRVFIANRGEVAARLVRACRDMGIEPVCAASEPDLAAGFPYLEQAAEVVCLGPGAATDSYLKMEEVVQAARQSHCTALHPGWGFLAENSLFAALCEQHGIKFIGPSPSVMDQMGLKVAARAAANAAGLPVVPGSDGMLTSVEEAIEMAESIGYPVVLKADAGGGGRGIRRCDDADEIKEAFVSAARESLAAFGNGDLYMEKYLVGGRHIEFQVIGDGHGKAIHLGERECSIQRRHQKLLEEAPSPALSAEQRDYYGGLSAAAAAQWNYAGVGTMEYLLADDGKLYFLEMNTRLQVEHPVTECITGIDLVQTQIRIAAGEGLPCKQEDVSWNGHAIEVRLNAEDPEQDFRPAPGRLKSFELPQLDGIRVDSHLTTGSKIPPHYDSLIAKVIAHGGDRKAATNTMLSALEQTRIEGVPTTAGLHIRILGCEDFQKGAFDTLWLTDFLERS
ncbi:MAG: acetyl-CoA carboxylase biotin carboxylase subunit [Planctomycetota bacterium]|jgi:acetyl-CoA carboxylase biotin carboxylase subunit|nr:acetyl-CoA carboxylase biotin carboxylase subunit [Planctomycetota bacterium]